MTGRLMIVMPRLSDSMEEGTVLRWVRRSGETVDIGDELVEIESDKATIVYEAESRGVLTATIREGETVSVGAPIGWLANGDIANGDIANGDAGAPGLGDGPPVQPAAIPAPAPRRLASPVARRVARAHALDLAEVDGTGPGGRVTRADVERAVAARRDGVDRVVVDGGPASVDATIALESFTPAQRIVAERMTASRREVPDFELRMRIDAEPVTSLRADIRAEGVRTPSVNAFVLAAAGIALREFPRANAAFREGGWERRDRVNIGVAIATGANLLVGTIADADRKSVGQIDHSSRVLAERARAGTITPAEMDGATFTVSNLGMYGVDGFTAVIPPNQAAILSVGAAVRVPVVRDDRVVPGLVIELGLSCDHRVLYGADAAQFLGRIRELLESPLRILIR